ncbi:enoyl-CoA hydratase [Pinisolibacter aquiterrae]|uniref:enoyl-CoA hydratase n=1 Tax=Pinisolibacter aquiterrae TaxID=2815579 RepID=UPI001C3E4320|nr:enoyl-CoA hydratase [Pinisolibacter aquiterrae]MBV5266007.1 enoyl-CoA hydratase/isomerase family protein [Pinisolibacter aquiterrae]MCC8237136.1 enoyl-CoA hydratase-related protein [Pinisolibacter aquiterrae]
MTSTSETPAVVTLESADPRIRIEVEGAVGRLVVANPERRNAVSLAMWQAIPGAVAALVAHPDVRVIVVRGDGDLAFVSGADISEFATVRKDAASARAYEASNAEAFSALRHATKPTIAMIRGFCLGGGMGLAVACDIRIAADDAVFGIPAARLGVGYPPDCIADVVAAVGPQRAKEMFFTARRMTAAEALEIGLLAAVHSVEALENEAIDLATVIAHNAPLTLRAAKAAIDAVVDGALPTRRETLVALTDACFASADFAEGRTAFLEKREAKFHGR